VNISRACERGLALEVAAAEEKLWLEENGPALDAANAYVEARGLPLARHRKF
jgi:antitoxin CcdA